VEGMDGRIWAESPGPGRGSTFSFTVPLAAPPVTQAESPLWPSRGRILLAQDDPSLAALILEQLAVVGYAVEAVASGDDVISRVRAERPAAVVLDVGLESGLDGWATLAALRDNPLTSDVPIVVSARNDGQERSRALSVDEFVLKPFPAQRLLRALQRLADATDARPVAIIDHDPVAREVMRQVLEQAGFGVVIVDGDDMAVQTLREDPPLAVILDLAMTGANAFELLESMRSDELIGEVPVVGLIPGESSGEEREALRQRSMDALRKPGGPGMDIAAALLRTIKTGKDRAGSTPVAVSPAACSSR